MLDKVPGNTGGQRRAPSIPSQIGRIQPAAAAEVVNAANLVRKLDGPGFCLHCFSGHIKQVVEVFQDSGVLGGEPSVIRGSTQCLIAVLAADSAE